MYGGVVAGLLSTVLSAVATAYFFMLPELSLRLVSELKGANARIRTLSDMLPLCPDCKRVRVGSDWKPVERYLAD